LERDVGQQAEVGGNQENKHDFWEKEIQGSKSQFYKEKGAGGCLAQAEIDKKS